MSFRCAHCGKVSTAGRMVVVERRDRAYYARTADGYEVVNEMGDPILLGTGWEIVREERWCYDHG